MMVMSKIAMISRMAVRSGTTLNVLRRMGHCSMKVVRTKKESAKLSRNYSRRTWRNRTQVKSTI
jgi:hypothetical protein